MLTMIRTCVAALPFSFYETCPTLVQCPVPCRNTERATWARAGPSRHPQELWSDCRARVFRALASLHIPHSNRNSNRFLMVFLWFLADSAFLVEGVVLVLMVHGTQLFYNVRTALGCALELVVLLFFCCSSSLSFDLCVL